MTLPPAAKLVPAPAAMTTFPPRFPEPDVPLPKPPESEIEPPDPVPEVTPPAEIVMAPGLVVVEAVDIWTAAEPVPISSRVSLAAVPADRIMVPADSMYSKSDEVS